jgi:hypothetical protein
MQPIQAIEGLDFGYHAGNVLKYLYRFRFKHKQLSGQLEDLKKARYYLDRLIEMTDNDQENP